MSKTRCLAAGGLAAWLLLAGAAVAQAQVRVDVERREPGGRRGHFQRVSTVIGSRVMLQDNAPAGKVEDIVLDENGCVEYMVVASEDRYVLVPWGAATVNFERRTVTVDMPVTRFREVPTFTRDRWPDFGDTRYIEGVNRHFKIRPRPDRREDRREERRDDRRDRREDRRP
jgi:hypothetical protein